MTNEHQKQDGRTPDLVERMRTMAAMLRLGEEVSLTHEVELIEVSAAEVERLRNLERYLHDEIRFMRNAAKENHKRAEAAEKRLAEARAVIARFARMPILDAIPDAPGRTCVSIPLGWAREAAEWMEKNQ